MNKTIISSLWIALFCFVLSIGLILAITWPWCLHFNGEFLNHWDPPFHAWKLEFIARRIIAGDWFVRSTNTNMLYPYSGTLYYEALQWPPAVFAAMLFSFTSLSSELIYHITLVIFWALSAPCMYYLLRQLECKIIPAVVGSVIFCVLPHRISYMVEFQMEIIFAMPLFFAFLLRWFKNHRIIDGFLAVICWWLFAVSELYQAVFVAMTVPFIALAFITKKSSILKEKKFWFSASLTIFFGICLLFVLLVPYLQQHSAGAVHRSFSEIRNHSAQPFSFLIPFGRFAPWTISARDDEFSLYPTITLLLLTFGASIFIFLKIIRYRKESPAIYWSGLLFSLSTMLFFGIALLLQFRMLPILGRVFHIWTISSLLMVFSAIAFAIFHQKCENSRITFMKGFLSITVLFFFFSFGPLITLGSDKNELACHYNLLYIVCYNYIFPFLSGFRVVSRFGVIVLFFMILAASIFVDVLIRRISKLHQAKASILLGIIIICGVVIEAIPREQWGYVKIDNQRDSPAISRFIEQHPICTLAICPSGPRRIEGPRMFSLLKGDWPYVYAWGGYFPEYSSYIASEINSHDPKKIHYELSRFFPDAILMIDKASLKPVKYRVPEFNGLYIENTSILDYDKIYSSIAEIQDYDERFSIFKLKQHPPMPEFSKIFRSDVAIANPNLKCKINSAPKSMVNIYFNNSAMSTIYTDAKGEADFTANLAQYDFEKSSFNTFSVKADGTNLVSISSFMLFSEDGIYHDVMMPYSQ